MSNNCRQPVYWQVPVTRQVFVGLRCFNSVMCIVSKLYGIVSENHCVSERFSNFVKCGFREISILVQ